MSAKQNLLTGVEILGVNTITPEVSESCHPLLDLVATVGLCAVRASLGKKRDVTPLADTLARYAHNPNDEVAEDEILAVQENMPYPKYQAMDAGLCLMRIAVQTSEFFRKYKNEAVLREGEHIVKNDVKPEVALGIGGHFRTGYSARMLSAGITVGPKPQLNLVAQMEYDGREHEQSVSLMFSADSKQRYSVSAMGLVAGVVVNSPLEGLVQDQSHGFYELTQTS